MSNLYHDLVSSLLPTDILQHFSLVFITEKAHGIELRMEEYAEFYLKLYRRRWKESGSTTHCSCYPVTGYLER